MNDGLYSQYFLNERQTFPKSKMAHFEFECPDDMHVILQLPPTPITGPPPVYAREAGPQEEIVWVSHAQTVPVSRLTPIIFGMVQI